MNRSISRNGGARTRGSGADFALLVYIHFWVLEGALRKWVPGLDAVLYVGRDAFALLAIFALIIFAVPQRRGFALFWIITGGLGVVVALQVIAGQMSLTVGAVGLRSYIAPLLGIFIAFCYAGEKTLALMARALLIYVPIQLILGILQVTSSRSSWWNREVSGADANFVQDGVVRISGTFASPSGLAAYLAIALAVSVGLYLQKGINGVSRRWAMISTIGCVVVITISGSRGAVLAAAAVVAALLVSSFVRSPRTGFRLVLAVAAVIAGAIYIVAAFWPAVGAAFIARFEAADRAENSTQRLLEQAFGFLAMQPSILGSGAGVHSQSGIVLGSGAEWIEIDSMRWVAELGLVGIVLACVRVVIAILCVCMIVFRAASRSWVEVGLLGYLATVLSFGAVTINPSAQGAVGVAVGFLVAARRAAHTTQADASQVATRRESAI